MARPKGGCRLRARLDVRRGLNAARPSHAMHSLGLSMSRKRAPCLPKADPCFDSTTRQDMFWGRAGMNARPRWGKRAVYAALNSCSTPPTVAPRANAIPLPFGTHQDNRLRSSHTPHACSQPCCTRADIVTRVPSTASESSAPLARAPALTCAACHLPVHRRIAKVWTHDVSTPSHPTPQLHRLLLKYATIFELRPRPLPRAPCRAPLPLPP